MRFDAEYFDRVVARRGTSCVKWDAKPPVKVDGDIIPLWVADMDFPAAPCIQKALEERVEHGVFGYTSVPQSWQQSVRDWFSSRHGWAIDPSWIQYTTGVVPGVSAVIKALCPPGHKVVILTPVYNCFFSSIRNNGCIVSESGLRIAPGPRYEIDFEDLERRCSEQDADLLLFCNPHNPAGRVWSREELRKVADIARRCGVTVVSDEIHCEITAPGIHYTPFATVDQSNCVTLGSPSKSFNIAGLQMAFIVSDNPLWREKIDRALNINEICDVNPFAPVAGQAAYTPEGAAWLEGLNDYIFGNYRYMKDVFAASLPSLAVFEMEGTYLAWVDCRSLRMSSAEIENSLLQGERVWVNAGTMYGCEGFIRVNLATPSSLLREGLERLVHGLKRLLAAQREILRPDGTQLK